MARRGIAKTTVEDVAREAGLSRATVYRTFPGGRDELVDATVAWATLDFFAKLYDRIQGAASLEEVMERGIMFAHRSILEHEVLQRVMQTEPDKLLPALTVESNRIRAGIADVLAPYLVDRGLARGRGPPGRGRLPGPDGPVVHLGARAAGTWRTRSRWPDWSGPSSWPAWSCPAAGRR